MQTVHFQDLGRIDYQQAWDLQTQLHKNLVDNKLAHRHLQPKTYPQAHQLLLCEHPPVFTLGKSGSMQNLLLSEAELTERGIQFFPINRGGDITYHGPGQIVGYPILDLECFFTDVHRYVRNIEEVIIRAIADFGVEGFRIKDYTGVWVTGESPGITQNSKLKTQNWKLETRNRKICAIGVHLSRWTTLHGWAFNVATDLRYFDLIIPCGIADDDKTVTSLELELGNAVDMAAVKASIRRHFADVFECSWSE